MTPVPVLIAYVAIAGWPTLKLASVIARRALRRSLRAAARRFDGAAYSEADRHIVRDMLVAKYEPTAVMLTPAMLVGMIGVFAFSPEKFSELSRKAEESALSYRQSVVDYYRRDGLVDCDIRPDLIHDPIFRKIDNISIIATLLKYPVSFLLSLAVMLSFGWIILAVKGVRSWKSTLKAMLRLSTRGDHLTLSFN